MLNVMMNLKIHNVTVYMNIQFFMHMHVEFNRIRASSKSCNKFCNTFARRFVDAKFFMADMFKDC
jgi:hypothetical protein